MWGKRKKELKGSLAVNIKLLEMLDDVLPLLPKEKQKEIEHKLEIIMAKHVVEKDGKVISIRE